MSTHDRFWLVGLFCLVLSNYGCGTTDDGDGGVGNGDGGGGSGSVSFDSYCDDFAQMTCDVAQQCDCLGGLSIDLCISYQTMGCDDEVTEPVEAGRMSYDPARGGQCLTQLRAIISDCSLEDAYWPDACDLMLVGLVSEGETCDGDDECQNELECYDDECVQVPTANQSCHPDYDCADNLYCGDDDICHPYRGDGQPCPEGDRVCDDDLYCDSRTVTCEPYITSGGSCTHAPWDCDDDLYCSDASETCLPYPAVGLDCAGSDGDCADDLYCDENDVCRAQGDAGAGCSEDEQCVSDECADGVCEADQESACPFL